MAAGRPKTSRNLDFLEAELWPSEFERGQGRTQVSILPSSYSFKCTASLSMDLMSWSWVFRAGNVAGQVYASHVGVILCGLDWEYTSWHWLNFKRLAWSRFEPGMQSLYNGPLPGCNLYLALAHYIYTVVNSFHVVFYLISKTLHDWTPLLAISYRWIN